MIDSKTITMLKRKSNVLTKILRLINSKRLGATTESLKHFVKEKREINNILKPIL